MKVQRVAIYIRVSTAEQAEEGYSLQAQERTLRQWVKQQQYVVTEVYADIGISGADISHRPAMCNLLADARRDKYDMIVFWSLSRFTRSVADLYNTIQLLEGYGITMVSYTEPFDTSTPPGRAMIGIVGVFAQLERELTAERVTCALAERAMQGKRTCNCVLDYDAVGNDELCINPAEAEYVRYIYNTYVQRKSMAEVAELCRQRGYCGKRGRTPCPQSIHVILTRPIYTGYNVHHGLLYKGTHEPIISVELYNRAQTIVCKVRFMDVNAYIN